MSTAWPALAGFLLPLALSVRSPVPQGTHCSAFTAAEVAKLLGTAVEDGESAAMGTGCQWFGRDGQSLSAAAATREGAVTMLRRLVGSL